MRMEKDDVTPTDVAANVSSFPGCKLLFSVGEIWPFHGYASRRTQPPPEWKRREERKNVPTKGLSKTLVMLMTTFPPEILPLIWYRTSVYFMVSYYALTTTL